MANGLLIAVLGLGLGCGRVSYDALAQTDAGPVQACEGVSAGSLDSTLGGGGTVVLTPPPDQEYRGKRIVFDSADRALLAFEDTGTVGNSSFAVARIDDGGLDADFGQAGMMVVRTGGNNEGSFAIQPAAGGWVVSGWSYGGTGNDSATLTGFDDSGNLRTDFGSGGSVVIDLGAAGGDRFYDSVVNAAGEVIAAGMSDSTLSVGRFSSAGAPDTSIGTAGVETLLSYAGVAYCLADAGSSIYVGGNLNSSATIIRLQATDLTLDDTFGTAGEVTVEPSGVVRAIVPVADQLLVLGSMPVGGTGRAAFLARLVGASGAVDSSFGTNGFAPIGLGGATEITADLAVDAQGRILFTMQSDSTLLIGRLLADGTLDTSFGDGGYAVVWPDAGTELGLRGLAIDSQGRVGVSGWVTTADGVAALVARVCP